MELFIQKNELLNALERIEGIIDVKRLIPILTHCLFTAKDNTVQLFGTDLNISVITKCQAEIADPGKIVVPAKKFYELLKDFPDGRLSLKYDSQTNRLMIKMDNYQFALACASLDDFPSIPDYKSPDTIEFCASFLSNIIKKIQFCISPIRHNIGLTGMVMDFRQKSIACATTDGHRLAVGEFYMPRYSEDFKYASQLRHISKKTIGEYVKLFSNDEDIHCHVLDRGISFEQNDTVLIAKFLELDYPNYATLIPGNIAKIYQLNRQEMISAVKATAPLSNELTNSVKLDFAENQLTVKTSDSEIGTGEVKLGVMPTYPQDKYFIEFNAFYLIDILNSLSEDTFELCVQENPRDSVIIRDKERTHFTYVIMPLS